MVKRAVKVDKKMKKFASFIEIFKAIEKNEINTLTGLQDAIADCFLYSWEDPIIIYIEGLSILKIENKITQKMFMKEYYQAMDIGSSFFCKGDRDTFCKRFKKH